MNSVIKSDENSKWLNFLTDCLPARYVVAILAFLGFVLNYALRVNINIAIVAMVNHTAIPKVDGNDTSDECGNEIIEDSDDEDGEFVWDESRQALILGSFFWGYITTQLPGGRLGELIGVKRLFGLSLLGASLLTLLTPVAAEWDYKALIVLRVLIGVCEGVTFPSMHAMIARWAPPHERSSFATFIYAGSQAGTVIALPAAGYIAATWGWRAVFYIMGGFGMVFVILWFTLVYDSPEQHPWIKSSESSFILNAIRKENSEVELLPVPWKEILRSRPFWALIIADLGNNWGFWLLLTVLPSYMKNMLHYDIKKNGLRSAAPYLSMWMFSLIIGRLCDFARQRKLSTPTRIRNVANSIAHYGPALCLIGVIYSGCNANVTYMFLVFAVTLQGALYAGFLSNHVDMAPNFAGTLFGITNMLAALPSWIAPLTTGYIVEGQQTLAKWSIVFWIAIGIYLFDNTVYVLFSSSEEQSWNRPKLISSSSEGNEKEKKEKISIINPTFLPDEKKSEKEEEAKL